MSGIQRPIGGFRFVEVRRSETLQQIAARELGSATRWPEIVGLNGLLPPFVTDDPAAVRPGVVLSGGYVKVPAAASTISAEAQPEEVFGRDAILRLGRLGVEAGDLEVVSGSANLAQALRHAVETERGELIFHADYGCLVRQIVGTVNGPTAAILAAEYVKATVLADSRVDRVSRADAVVAGDAVTVQVEVYPVTGKPIDLAATI